MIQNYDLWKSSSKCKKNRENTDLFLLLTGLSDLDRDFMIPSKHDLILMIIYAKIENHPFKHDFEPSQIIHLNNLKSRFWWIFGQMMPIPEFWIRMEIVKIRVKMLLESQKAKGS